MRERERYDAIYDRDSENTNKSVEKIYNAITEIDDALVDKAENYTFSQASNMEHTVTQTDIDFMTGNNSNAQMQTDLENHPQNSKVRRFLHKHKRALLALVACICLVYGVGMFFIWGPAAGGGSGGSGTSYMSYAGPVFPLSTTSDASGIEVTRHTNWDFSPYKSEQITEDMHPDISENTETYTYDRYESESIVTDQYELTNTTNVDITLSLTYPFAAHFTDSIDVMPEIKVNGNIALTEFLAGKFSGSFTPAIGDEDSEEQLNLHNISSWKDYKALLSGDLYFTEAQKEFPSLDIPIIVYEYANLTYVGEEKASNPTFAIHFKHDPSKTTLSGWGWNAGGWEGDGSGYYGCSRVYSPGGNDRDKGATAYLIVIGDDIETPVTQGYGDGGCDKGEEVQDVSVDFKKYETTLEDFIVNICFAEFDTTYEYLYGTYDTDNASLKNLVTKEMALGYIAQLMYDDGILSGDGIERYDSGWLENYVYDYPQMSRVMYLTFDVTIPAGSSITVEATMVKEASIDFVGKNKHRNGYDMVTTLASPLFFTKQTASLSNYEEIEILDQNFGFDLENGITEVELDIQDEHYWMDIKKKAD